MAVSRVGLRAVALALTALLGRADADEEKGTQIVVESPVEGAILGGDVRVTGRIQGDSRGMVVVNGQPAPLVDGKFEATVAAKADGPLKIRVVFGAIGVPAIVAERSVVVDRAPPVITIVEPATESVVVPTRETVVRGKVTDVTLKEVTVNGSPLSPVAGERPGDPRPIEATFLLPEEGEVVVEIVATDAAGHKSTLVRRIRYSASAVAPPPTPAGPTPGPTAGPAPTAGPTPPPAPPELPAHTPNPWPRRGKEILLPDTVARGLEWLSRHQTADGSWDAEDFHRWLDGKPLEGDKPAEGAGAPGHTVGTTGLVLLAFLGAGHSDRGEGPYARHLTAGLRWIQESQDEDGCYGPRAGSHYVYDHAIASLAMLEAFGLSGNPVHRASAQKALDFIAKARNPGLAWRYGIRPDENDTSVTGWMTLALLAARYANEAERKAGRPEPFVVDAEAFDGVRAWLRKMTDENGRVGYKTRGSGPARTPDLVEQFPGEYSEAMTAIGVLLRTLLGENPSVVPALRKGVNLCLQPSKGSFPGTLPLWRDKWGTIDMYYWHYGALAMYQAGGKAWDAWATALKKAAEKSQRSDGDSAGLKGSWDPLDPWGREGGRVYATAMMILCLETPSRYERAFP
jgi:hypothetical protein